jgi:hypothetical protein
MRITTPLDELSWVYFLHEGHVKDISELFSRLLHFTIPLQSKRFFILSDSEIFL